MAGTKATITGSVSTAIARNPPVARHVSVRLRGERERAQRPRHGQVGHVHAAAELDGKRRQPERRHRDRRSPGREARSPGEHPEHSDSGAARKEHRLATGDR
ncbi:MAG TPA: hypothetical protein VKA42_01035 [Acidimicrobiales bacterium]|nr:hypothetical protein [Acidimicrobiales bacterium]